MLKLTHLRQFIFRFTLMLGLILMINIVFSQTFFNEMEGENNESIWIGSETYVTGIGHSGYGFSLTDSINPYGLGIEMGFPENQWNNDIKMEIEAWVIADNPSAEAVFVISISKEANQIFWKGIPLSKMIIQKEKWYKFKDSILIPRDIVRSGKLKAFLWNNNGKNKVGIDDLKVNFEKLHGKSYLSDIPSDSIASKISSSSIIFSNIYYSIYYDDEKKSIGIFDKSLIPIINNLLWLTEIVDEETALLSSLKFKNSFEKRDKTILKFKGKNKYINLNLSIICDKYSPKIEFESSQRFKKKTELSRSTLVFDMNARVTEVYRYNRHLDSDYFADEYWLEKEGLKLGEKDNSFQIYHCPDISSIQYSKLKSQVFVNLDWEKDHPFFRFPLMPDTSNFKMEQSQSSFKFWEKSVNSFSAYAGLKNNNIARFMKNPDGYEATYIWTEHADFTDIRTNRATYYGSEKITNADSAIGGFVKYNIPVTKSVFYDNPDSISNFEASNGLLNSLESTIKTDAAFYEFLKDIHDKGSEICLHTPEQYTTTRVRLEEALEFMQKQFGSKSWIDHGNNNGLQNNREDLICDGTLEDSPWYSMDLWEKYGVNYLHNAYFEEHLSFYNRGFGYTIEKPFSGWANNLPSPDYWRHKSKTENIVHWQTPNVLFIENESLWNYYFNEENMNDFISTWSVKFNHCYPAWVDPKKGFWKYNSDSLMIAQDVFNATLKLMSDYRKEGKLNVSSIQDYLDYRIATDSVEYNLLTDGRVKVTNSSEQNINGISFATIASYVLVDRQQPMQKVSGNNIIFWFNLNAGESKIIRLID